MQSNGEIILAKINDVQATMLAELDKLKALVSLSI
jgi:hypothetical protein